MLRSSLDAAAIDACGASNTDTEEECEYDLIVYHLVHQYDMDTPDMETKTAEKSTFESVCTSSVSDDSNGSPPADEEKSIEGKSSPVTILRRATTYQDRQDFHQRVLFDMQHDFLFEWVSTNNLYIARPRADPQKKLALKIVTDSDCSKDGYCPMEIRILSHIHSNRASARNLQQMCGFVITPRGYAFFSPFANDLRELCKHRDFAQSPQEIKRIIRELLLALESLHRMDVIHRDVKQSNILWQDNTLTLIDYDLATWNQQGRKHFTVHGTLGYIAPEILDFERDHSKRPEYYDSKIDIYSAGVVFGSLLFNVPENDVSETYVRAFRQKANVLLASDPLAVDLLLHMIALKPASRPTAHALLQHQYFLY